MVARLTPDQKVACSNHVGVSDSIFVSHYHHHIIIIIIILTIIIDTFSLVKALLYTVHRPSLVYFFAHGRDFTANRFFPCINEVNFKNSTLILIHYRKQWSIV